MANQSSSGLSLAQYHGGSISTYRMTIMWIFSADQHRTQTKLFIVQAGMTRVRMVCIPHWSSSTVLCTVTTNTARFYLGCYVPFKSIKEAVVKVLFPRVALKARYLLYQRQPCVHSQGRGHLIKYESPTNDMLCWAPEKCHKKCYNNNNNNNKW